ncbi:hypothetical protein FI667_g9732, partial [Globisporangium splendens]
MQTPPQRVRDTSSADKMSHYLQRYEQLQQERVRQRRQRRASMEFTLVSPSHGAESSDVERLSEDFGSAATFLENRYDYNERSQANEPFAADKTDTSAVQDACPHASDAALGNGRMEQGKHDEDDFDLPAMDAFPQDQYLDHEQNFTDAYAAGQEEFPDIHFGVSVASEEFVDAETYLEKNQLGGDDSFEHDVELQSQWEKQDESALDSESGRPSDFFEKRSRNMERVEFALEDDQMRDSVDEEYTRTEAARESSFEHSTNLQEQPDRAQINNRLDSSLSFSDTNTALSSGYDVHFDNSRQAYTPNSLKHLQEKSRRRNHLEIHREEADFDRSAHHERDAHSATDNYDHDRIAIPEGNEHEEGILESVEAMKRGPGMIRRALHEIDMLIDDSSKQAAFDQSAAHPGDRLAENDGRCEPRNSSADAHDVVREYDMSLETGLPLSRTTDSWGDDPEEESLSVDREDRFDSPPRRRESSSSVYSGVNRTRRHEQPDFGTLRDHRFSSSSILENTRQLDRINEEQSSSYSSVHTRGTMSPSVGSYRQDAGQTSQVGTAREPAVPAVSHNSNAAVQTAGARDGYKRRSGSMKASDLVSHNQEDKTSSRQQNVKKLDASVQFSDDFVRSSNNAGLRNSEQSKRKYSGSTQDKVAGNPRDWNKNGYSENDYDSSPNNFDRQKGNQKNNYSSEQPHQNGSLERKTMKESEASYTAINPIQLSRRCRRLLCSVGETMTERIVFSNGGDTVGRISVSLLPLSTGCQQFAVMPAVLELQPGASSSFRVTFAARTPGVAAGIFQFRGVGVNALFAPYEVLIEASVRRNLSIEEGGKPTQVARLHNTQNDRQVEELRKSTSINEVEIGPTFVRFERSKIKNGGRTVSASKVKITNNTDATLPFKVACSHENLKITPDSGVIPPASEVFVKIVPVSRPVDRSSNGGSLVMAARSPTNAEKWAGSFTVVVGKKISREVSFVISREIMETLPDFDEIARSRHHISSQTDSFYYTKKRNRKGLYFHARAVECGSCNVGESHQVPVYICNGSNSPKTVFLQDLMEPFSCFYTTTTIEPRKFIEVPVTFTPKVAGKVSTSLFAYSVTDKAVVTLVARGI